MTALAKGKRTTKRGTIAVRTADESEAPALHALISAHLDEGHLLPRSLEELTGHATRFVVATRGRRIVGCADLAALSQTVAEIRSLAVDRRERGSGVGAMIVGELRRRARDDGFEKLCAFTHAPGYFIQMGFSIVPHVWLLEKLATDCVKCPQFQKCGQHAMVVPLDVTCIERPDLIRGTSHDLVRGIALEPISANEGAPAPEAVAAGCA